MTGSDWQISEMQRSTKRHHSKKLGAGRILKIACAAMLLSIRALSAQPASTCEAGSAGHRVALLELYTSEGCNSCPPADRFLRSLADRGFDSGKVVALAFHVDYWDGLGWRDRFAHPAFSARQRLAADRAGARFVYTPQFLLDGRDLAQGWLSGNFADKVASINRQRASAGLRVSQRLLRDTLEATLSIDVGTASTADLFVAVLESGLASAVKAGENSGKLLEHDSVVRVLEGPLPAASQSIAIPLLSHWNRGRTEVAVFVQERSSGKVLQALAMPLCAAN